MRQKADGWELTFQGHIFQLEEIRGLTLIAHLLSRPNEAINARELAFLGKNDNQMATGAPSSDLGPVLDENAKRAYRARVQELQEEMERARSSGDEEGALTIEQSFVSSPAKLREASGCLDAIAEIASDAERARVRVTNSIKFAIGKIAEHLNPSSAPIFKGPFEPGRLAATFLNLLLRSFGTFDPGENRHPQAGCA